MTHIAVALILVAVIDIASAHLSLPLQTTPCAGLFVLASVFLAIPSNPQAESCTDEYDLALSASPQWPVAALIGMALSLLAGGIVWSLKLAPQEELTWSVGTLVGAVLILVFVAVALRRVALGVLPALSVALTQLAILGAMGGIGGTFVPLVALWCGCTLLWAWSISVCCWQGRLEPDSSGRMASLGMLAVVVPNLVGEIIGRNLELNLTGSLALASAVLVFAIELITFDRRFFFALPKQPSPPGTQRTQQDVVREIASAYDFTQRESSVFLLLWKGYSMRRVADELSLSENTVKTHAKSVYAKIGVHSRQALISFAESCDKNQTTRPLDTEKTTPNH